MGIGRLRALLVAGIVAAPSFAVATSAPAGAADPWIDTSNRAEVLASYQAEFDRTEPASGWNGDVSSCDAGTTSSAYRASLLRRVNWYRRMAGLPTVAERADYTTATQQASLMMSAENQLSHAPAGGWACHTGNGAATAGKSNLALGVNGVAAIDAYVRDPGSNNNSVGHRRTMFYPQLREVGTGDVDASPGHHAANTLRVFDDNVWGQRPAVREGRGFVAWPPSGYVPAETAWGRWSFSLAGGDFAGASVTITDSLGLVPITILDRIQPENPNALLAPEASIVWAMSGDTNSELMPAPTHGDECYSVTIGGVRVGGAVQPAYSYDTCVIDPDHTPGSITPQSDDPNCGTARYDAWNVPCWRGRPTLGAFVDITATWQREPVAWLVGNEITTGVSPTRYAPDSPVTRAQAATLIWRLAGSPAPPGGAPDFVDVGHGSYYRDAVRWMAHQGITTGTGGGRFSPDAPATRAEFVTLLWRLVDEPAGAGTAFTDLTADWQHASVRWAAGTGVTTGTSPTTFSPDTAVTRGQAAALLARFADAIA